MHMHKIKSLCSNIIIFLKGTLNGFERLQLPIKKTHLIILPVKSDSNKMCTSTLRDNF